MISLRHAVHSIYNELEDPSEMQPIVRTSLALCSIVYITTSFFGFLLFGDQTMDDVLTNFDTNLGVPYIKLTFLVLLAISWTKVLLMAARPNSLSDQSDARNILPSFWVGGIL